MIGLAVILIGVVAIVAQNRPRLHESDGPAAPKRAGALAAGAASDTLDAEAGDRPTAIFIESDWDRFRLRAESEYLRIVRAGDPAAINRLTSRTLRGALEEIGVTRHQIDERPGAASVAGAGRAPVRWRVQVSPRTSLYRVNDAITQAIRALGGHVLHGAEKPAPLAGISLDLRVGYGDHVTHAIIVEPNPTITDAGARVAFVVTDLEEADADLLRAYLESGIPFTLAVRPDRPEGPRIARDWRATSREVFALLAMEPRGYPQNDPGKHAILLDHSRIEIEDRVQRCLSGAAPVTGVMTRMGSAAVNDPDVMKAVLGEMRRLGLPFLDAHGVGPSVVEEIGETIGARTATVGGTLDAASQASARTKLAALIETAVQRGTLIVTIRANGGALAAIEQERSALKERGVELVPASALIL
ncbi:MAG TPA: divergent polysaccharide deacetylase family protein [Acidobacteriota bacterium]|nr:divergent polysaccharide deacetylase family protein [Acidobacteriota bacterium]